MPFLVTILGQGWHKAKRSFCPEPPDASQLATLDLWPFLGVLKV